MNIITNQSSFGIGDTTGFVAIDRVAKAIIVSFRGSESLANFITNLEFTFANANSVCLGCQLSTGFFNDWKVANTTVINAVKQATGAAENQGYKLVVTGHSLGAAVATICAAILRGNYSYTLSLVTKDIHQYRKRDLTSTQYTYGSPMVGNAAFVTYVTNQPLTQGAGQNYRVTHQNDLVPNLPGYSFDYRHVSPQYWITSPDNITVTTSDINVSSGIEDEMGDYYSLLEIFETSNAAHSWYFNHIDVCFADNNGTILNGR